MKFKNFQKQSEKSTKKQILKQQNCILKRESQIKMVINIVHKIIEIIKQFDTQSNKEDYEQCILLLRKIKAKNRDIKKEFKNLMQFFYQTENHLLLQIEQLKVIQKESMHKIDYLSSFPTRVSFSESSKYMNNTIQQKESILQVIVKYQQLLQEVQINEIKTLITNDTSASIRSTKEIDFRFNNEKQQFTSYKMIILFFFFAMIIILIIVSLFLLSILDINQSQ